MQVKGGMLLLAAHPRKTPTGKAVREIWFEYFWERRSKEWCWIFESGRILEEMREIPLIATFEVVTNAAAAPDSNYDLSLIFDFKNMDDLNAYQKHPMHVEFGKFITAIRESRACIDYEF